MMKMAGLILLATAVAWSVGKVIFRQTGQAEAKRTTVRLAHWQLESGLRQALEAVISEYERIHPDIKIEQVPIPERLGKNWTRTQLVGGTSPSIIQLGETMGINDEVLARYFYPLSDEVEEPNPYNAGTDLEVTPWRDTFIDALTSEPAYSEGLLDYYGIPGTIFTARMFYNKALLERITGSARTPETYAEFLELCRRVLAFNAEEKAAGRPGDVLPIAGSKYNTPFIVYTLYSAVTQKLVQESLTGDTLMTNADLTVMAYLNGQWNWDSPAVQKGLATIRQIGKFMQPGFLQLGRDDALFYFAQGRALMISTGSFDATSIRMQSPFAVGAFKLPIPAASDPEFTDYVMGPLSEASTGTGFVLGVVRDAPHTEIAVDFLRFLSSRMGSDIFSRVSNWLPATVGVELSEQVKPFTPQTDGYPPGLRPTLENFPNSSRVYQNNFYRLVLPNGSLGDFTAAVQKDYEKALIVDVAMRARAIQRNAAISDTVAAGFAFSYGRGGQGGHSPRVSELLEGQNQNETTRALLDYFAQKFPGGEAAR